MFDEVQKYLNLKNIFFNLKFFPYSFGDSETNPILLLFCCLLICGAIHALIAAAKLHIGDAVKN
jgi:hypothetical protein